MTIVLCYHAVSATWKHALSLAPETLDRQLASLRARGLRPVDAATAVQGERDTFHVTFDDVFRSLVPALPLLERHGIAATFFSCSGYADLGGAPLVVPELAEQPEAELAHEVASHTVSHAHLPRLSDQELDRELRESRRRLEDELRRPCRWLAYPFGDENGRVRAAAERAGYEASFALPKGLARPSRHAVPRVGIYRGDTPARFSWKTSPVVNTLLRRESVARRPRRGRIRSRR
jgi:peptidoglycan/xylan/chitin deacetylase (PgdA/CDA1 family)